MKLHYFLLAKLNPAENVHTVKKISLCLVGLGQKNLIFNGPDWAANLRGQAAKCTSMQGSICYTLISSKQYNHTGSKLPGT
jgi:hypothetical protein